MHFLATKMDFIDDSLKSEFVFINPKSKGQCGCGESLMTTQSKSYRNVLGKDLGPLSRKELDLLENQLGSSLKYVKSTQLQTQLMLDQFSKLQSSKQLIKFYMS